MLLEDDAVDVIAVEIVDVEALLDVVVLMRVTPGKKKS